MTSTQLDVLFERVTAAIEAASTRVAQEFQIAGDEAYILSFDQRPGVWETAEALGIVRWTPREIHLAEGATRWLTRNGNSDNGYPPWPDIATRRSYIEVSARVLLSLASAQQALRLDELVEPINRLQSWILDQFDQASGGWGAFLGSEVRTLPTAFAVRALAFSLDVAPVDDAGEYSDALDRGKQWIIDSLNPQDGGIGRRGGENSNVCSSSQAAWALARSVMAVPEELATYIYEAAGSPVTRQDVIDTIPDPAARVLHGRFELLQLGLPWSTIGVLSTRPNPRDPLVLELVEESLGTATGGVWSLPNGRYVWPTYFHVAALRLWQRTFSAYTEVTAADFSGARSVPTIPRGTATPVGREARKPRVFLSHRTSDAKTVERIRAILDLAGVETWLDQLNMVAGDSLDEKIHNGIELADAAAFIITRNFRLESGWLRREVEVAVTKRANDASFRLIPLLLGTDAEIPNQLKEVHCRHVDDDIAAAREIIRTLRSES